MDKGSVFYDNTSKSPFPSRVHLWLVGLGIQVHFIEVPPPLKQAKVERSHQTMDKQVLKSKGYKSWKQLFEKSNYRRQRLNTALPCASLSNQAPLEVYPEAIHSGRPFFIEQEYQNFNMDKIYHLLSQYTWYRNVSKDKTISIGGYVYYLKKAKPGSQVKIKFSKRTRLFIFRNVKERLLAKLAPKGISKETLSANSQKELIFMKRKLHTSKDFPLKT